MKCIYIMRHGESQPFAKDDAKRQLTSTGQQEAKTMARWLQSKVAMQRIWASPYLRAMETADIMHSVWPTIPLEVNDDITPDGEADVVKALVEQWSEANEQHLLLVSHMPLVSLLVQAFSYTGNMPMMATAAIACAQRNSEGRWDISWLASPSSVAHDT